MIGARKTYVPLVKPLVLERSPSKEVDSGSRPVRTLSGSLDKNSVLSEFTEFRRLSSLRRLALRPSCTSNGDFGLDPSISGSQQRSNIQQNSCVSVCCITKQPSSVFSGLPLTMRCFYRLVDRTPVHATTC